jgi:tetratricopeptide (TPR) repeat protein
MKRELNTFLMAALSFLLLCAGVKASAQTQSGQQPSQQQQPQQQQPQQQQKPSDDKKPNAAPLTMDSAPAPAASPEEDAAYKALQDPTLKEPAKKIQMAEDFLQKYPQSRYRPGVYQVLVSGYFATNNAPKVIEAGEKEIELAPNDTPVLAVVAQTIARSFNPKAPDAMKQLQDAEQYSKRAIELTPTLPKPDNLTDEAFAGAKNDTLAMAHGGLGLIYIREGKFDEAIPELEASIKSDVHPEPDPVNYYLLGLANQKTSHFESAAAAFTKCASLQSSLQATCKNGAEEAKKAGSTQLSAPN